MKRNFEFFLGNGCLGQGYYTLLKSFEWLFVTYYCDKSGFLDRDLTQIILTCRLSSLLYFPLKKQMKILFSDNFSLLFSSRKVILFHVKAKQYFLLPPWKKQLNDVKMLSKLQSLMWSWCDLSRINLAWVLNCKLWTL